MKVPRSQRGKSFFLFVLPFPLQKCAPALHNLVHLGLCHACLPLAATVHTPRPRYAFLSPCALVCLGGAWDGTTVHSELAIPECHRSSHLALGIARAGAGAGTGALALVWSGTGAGAGTRGWAQVRAGVRVSLFRANLPYPPPPPHLHLLRPNSRKTTVRWGSRTWPRLYLRATTDKRSLGSVGSLQQH